MLMLTKYQTILQTLIPGKSCVEIEQPMFFFFAFAKKYLQSFCGFGGSSLYSTTPSKSQYSTIQPKIHTFQC